MNAIPVDVLDVEIEHASVPFGGGRPGAVRTTTKARITVIATLSEETAAVLAEWVNRIEPPRLHLVEEPDDAAGQ